MKQAVFDAMPMSDTLTSLVRERKYLSIGTPSRRIDINMRIASLAHHERHDALFEDAIEDAKEASFGLLATRPLQPATILSMWGVAAISRNDALSWRLSRLQAGTFTSDRSKRPPENLTKALKTERYASMLIDLHFMLASIARRGDGSMNEANFLAALRSDKHARRTYVWIETLYQLIVGARSGISLNTAVVDRGYRMTRLLSRASREEREALDFSGLGVLGVAKTLGRTWKASPSILPRELIMESRLDILIRAKSLSRTVTPPLSTPAVVLRRPL